jgi:hypothetical protein
MVNKQPKRTGHKVIPSRSKKVGGSKWGRVRLLVEHLEDRVVPANILWVDNTPGMGGTQFTASGGTQPASVPGLTPGVNIFSTISAAVAAASPGDTINVADGAYGEAVNVNKTLTIRGNQFGVDARSARGSEAVVDGTTNGGKTPFDLTANNVTLDGFTVQGASNVNQIGFGIVLGAGTSGSQVLNNIIQNNITGIALANSGATQAKIQFNLIQNNNVNQPGGTPGHGIYTDQFVGGGTVSNILIDSNKFF